MSETKKTAIVFFPTDATPSNYEYAHEFWRSYGEKYGVVSVQDVRDFGDCEDAEYVFLNPVGKDGHPSWERLCILMEAAIKREYAIEFSTNAGYFDDAPFKVR